MATVLERQEATTITGVKPAALSGRGALIFVCCLFVLSGACGLGYEVVWAKFLGHFLGNTVLLHTAVLGTFVAGLALGSLAIGRRADKMAAPLKVYGFLEIGIAAYAIFFPNLADLGQNAVYGASRTLPPGSVGLIVVKMLIGAVLLALPTLLMGATFPVLTAHVERSQGRNLGANGANWLYFANCSGAVIGTLLTGFFLIPTLGLTGTVLGVGILNLLIGVSAVVAEKSQPAAPPIAVLDAGADGTAMPRAQMTRQERMVLIGISLSGATAFFYELVWTRLFAITLGSSTYSFTLMLAAFITGLALGSIVAGLAPTYKKPLFWFATAETLIGLVIALSVPLYPRLPYTFWQWKWLLNPNPESIGLYHLFQYGVIFSAMAVPTFLFGLTFPVAIKAATEGNESGSIAPRAAAVYGWNTVGTLIGTLLAGCVLIPFLGLMRTLQVGAALNLVIGLLVLPVPLTIRRWLAGLAVPACLALLLTQPWHPEVFTVGLFRHRDAPPASWKTFLGQLQSRKLAFYREDFGSTVAVVTNGDKGNEQLTLIVDGKPDASSATDMPTQVLLAQLPLLFKPDAKDVFVLGLGSGVTAGNVLTHPVQNVDCVELSPAVVDAGRTFAKVNHNPFADSRFHLYQDDGKTFLASVNRQYDVIISEPTNPWIAGVGGLFTREAFEAQKRKLRPGGLVAQWFHSYELDDRLIATILRTFREVFPHTLIFQGCNRDYIIVGSEAAIAPDYRAIAERMKTPKVAATLAPIGIDNVAALLASQTHTDEAVQALTQEGGINTDDYPQLEYLAPFAFYIGRPADHIRLADCRFKPGSGLLLDDYRKHFPRTQQEDWGIIRYLSDVRTEYPELLLRVLSAYVERYPDDEQGGLSLMRILNQLGRRKEALILAEKWASRGNAEAKKLQAEISSTAHQESINGLIL